MNSVQTEMTKEASLIEKGHRLICVNPVQGIYKGRCYIAADYIDPGVIEVTELDGTSVGCYQAGRFCIDWNAF